MKNFAFSSNILFILGIILAALFAMVINPSKSPFFNISLAGIMVLFISILWTGWNHLTGKALKAPACFAVVGLCVYMLGLWGQ